MNRRRFLAWLTGTAAGVAAAPFLDLDKILWEPDAKTIVIPARRELWTPTSLQRGDIFTIEGVYAVNPLTGRSTRFQQQFVITSDVSSGPVSVRAVYPSLEVVAPSLRRGTIQPLLTGDTIPMSFTA